MQISVENTSNLGRKLTISVPADTVDGAVESKLTEAQRNVRLPGFRPGKVPMREVRRRFAAGIRQEVLGEVMQRHFFEAVSKESIQPAGMPSMEIVKDASGEDFEFAASFDVYPEFKVEGLESIEVDNLTAEIGDADVEEMIETLRKQRATHEEADRAAADGDKVNIDYLGTKDGEEFAGGAAEGSDLVLGSGQMIPGFEDGIAGMKAGEEKVLALSFPEDYHAEELKGAAVEFKITLNKVFDEVLPEVNDEFIKNFGVKSDNVEDFKEEVRGNMERELKRATRAKLKNAVMDGLLESNDVEVPQGLISAEIDRQRQQMAAQFGGGQVDSSLLPDELFQEQAQKSVKTGLVLAELINDQDMKVDADRVKELIDEIASSYETPEEVVNYYYGNQEQLQQVENLALEEQVIDYILSVAKVSDKTVSYKDAVAPA